ncbi:MAG: DUF2628 domain-containing protein, partial [Pseudolabrys sp.]
RLKNVMPTFTVHAPPPAAGATESDPQRFLFVRDSFRFWAFQLGPLWMLYRRLWLVLVLYLIGAGVFGVGLGVLRAPVSLQITFNVVLALLVGLEAATLMRWTLERRRWRMLGFVVGDDEEDAERRFFAQWAGHAKPASPPPASGPQYAAPVRRGPPSGSDVIGLFPEPGGTA